jgi:hypothetical protein
MAYVKTNWINGLTPVNSTNLNKIEDGIEANDTLKAPLASPALTGNPTAPTQADGNDSTRLATTAYVIREANKKAPLNSPALTGIPTTPTPADNDNTTKIATTAFVKREADKKVAKTGDSMSGDLLFDNLKGVKVKNGMGQELNGLSTNLDSLYVGNTSQQMTLGSTNPMPSGAILVSRGVSLYKIWDSGNTLFKQEEITVTTTGWVASGDARYPWRLAISDSRVALSSTVNVSINLSDIAKAESCGLAPVTQALTGNFRLFAQSVPTQSFLIDYIVIGG